MSRQWFLKVYDNAHYQDEDASCTRGPYPSVSHAIRAAREIVDASLRSERAQARSVDDLLQRYRAFGEDPMVIGPDAPQFSAWTYAAARAAQVFAEPGSRSESV